MRLDFLKRFLATLLGFSSCQGFASANYMENIYIELALCSPELMAREASIAAAEGLAATEKTKRLPTFSLSAKSQTLSDNTSETWMELRGNYTVASFGKFDANESLAEQKLLVERIETEATGTQVLGELLLKKNSIEKLSKDISSLDAVIALQQKLLDRVDRRTKEALTSDADRNAVYSRVVQNENKVRESKLQRDVLMSEIRDIACTDQLQDLSLDNLPTKKPIESILTTNFMNASLRSIDAKVQSKVQEMKVNDLSLRPDLDLVGAVPVSENNKSNRESSLGLEFNVSYGNLGRAEAERSKSLEKELMALVRERSIRSTQRVEQLLRLEQQIIALKNDLIPNQQVSLKAVKEKLNSKERLFKAGRVSLFELLAAYDEVQSAELFLNRLISDLEEVKIRRAQSLDYLYR